MLKNWKPYLIGAAVMFILLAGLYGVAIVPKETAIRPGAVQPAIPPDAITITPLPTLRIIRGNDVAFEGQTELKQWTTVSKLYKG